MVNALANNMHFARVDERFSSARHAGLKATEICLSRFRIGATGVRVRGDVPVDADPPEVVHTSRAL